MSDINYFAGGVRAKAARRGADEGGGRLEIGGKDQGAGRSQVNSTTSRWSLGGCPLESLGILGQQIGHELMTLIEDLL